LLPTQVGDDRAAASANRSAQFQDPFLTAKGERRARVALKALETLWFKHRYPVQPNLPPLLLESSPKNDRLVYLTAAEVAEYLDEIADGGFATSLIGFTGGEPFMNPEACRSCSRTSFLGTSAPCFDHAIEADGKVQGSPFAASGIAMATG